MHKAILAILLLILSAPGHSQGLNASAQQCNGLAEIVRNAPNKGGVCPFLDEHISAAQQANPSAEKQHCLRTYEALKLEYCGRNEQTRGGGHAARQQIFAFLYSVPGYIGGPSGAVGRGASINDVAKEKNLPAGWRLVRQLDAGNCKSGFYILGFNNSRYLDPDYEPPTVKSAFMNCGYKTLDDAIDRGSKDFPIPFFQVVIGAVDARDGPATQLLCHFNSDYERGWLPGVTFSGAIAISPSDDERARRKCATLNHRIPVLVDREPAATIWVYPQ